MKAVRSDLNFESKVSFSGRYPDPATDEDDKFILSGCLNVNGGVHESQAVLVVSMPLPEELLTEKHAIEDLDREIRDVDSQIMEVRKHLDDMGYYERRARGAMSKKALEMTKGGKELLAGILNGIMDGDEELKLLTDNAGS